MAVFIIISAGNHNRNVCSLPLPFFIYCCYYFCFFINNTYAIIIQKLIYSRLIPAASMEDSANVRAATILNDRLRFLCFVIAGIVTDHVILL